MDKYYTVMIVPEKQKGVKSYRIPTVLFKSFAFLGIMILLLLSVLSYDYWKILQQVYENKHLSIENRQLKEQIQLFQMKMNTLGDDLDRINTFEKKLRIITGLEDVTKKGPLKKLKNLEDPNQTGGMETTEEHSNGIDSFFKTSHSNEPAKKSGSFSSVNSMDSSDVTASSDSISLNFQNGLKNFENNPKFLSLKNLYDKKIATSLGLQKSYLLTQKWSDLARRSFSLSHEYASFDYKYDVIKKVVSTIEKNIHELDQHLLDKKSFLDSTPTMLPADGWITSYFGTRMSPWAGRLKMHEGLDIGAPYGTAIFAPADGIITYSGMKAGFGKFVQIDHGYGIETLYAHNQALKVRTGQKVKRGTLLAEVGSTGYSTGPHLHYEVRVNGIAVDPLYFILN